MSNRSLGAVPGGRVSRERRTDNLRPGFADDGTKLTTIAHLKNGEASHVCILHKERTLPSLSFPSPPSSKVMGHRSRYFFYAQAFRKVNCLLLKQRCENSSDGMFTRDPTATDR